MIIKEISNMLHTWIQSQKKSQNNTMMHVKDNDLLKYHMRCAANDQTVGQWEYLAFWSCSSFKTLQKTLPAAAIWSNQILTISLVNSLGPEMDEQPELVVRVQFNDEWIVRFQVWYYFLKFLFLKFCSVAVLTSPNDARKLLSIRPVATLYLPSDSVFSFSSGFFRWKHCENWVNQ